MAAKRNLRRRGGLTLLEVMVALALMGLSGAALMGLAAQATHTLNSVRDQHARLERASEILARMSTWTREDLQAHTGDRAAGGFVVRLRPISTTLFSATVVEGSRELLSTVMYRPDSDDDDGE